MCPNVSVFLPTYNRAHVVREAIDSILAQSYGDFELIVVDDGSKDGTRELVQGIGDGRIRYLYQENMGVSGARNKGIGASRGRLVSFLDSDDLWKSDKLADDIAFFGRNPGVDVVFTDLEKSYAGEHSPSFMSRTIAFSRIVRVGEGGDAVIDGKRMFLVLLTEVPIKPSALTVKRHVFDRCGNFNEQFVSGEDWEFYLRISRSVTYGYIDKANSVLRVSRESLHLIEQERDHKGIIELLKKYRDECRDDRKTAAAIDAGIRNLTKNLAWFYVTKGQRSNAMKSLMRGYAETGSLELLARIAWINLPAGIRKLVKPGAR